MSALVNCPRCGRAPRLRESYQYAKRTTLFILKFECRRWFGLRLCFGPHREHWIAKDWYDVGLREAARKWNEAACV